MVPRRAPAPPRSSRSVRCPPTEPVLRLPRASESDRAHASGSRLRIRATGSRPMLLPKQRWRSIAVRTAVGERDRAVDVDHRSSRSASRSASNCSKVSPGSAYAAAASPGRARGPDPALADAALDNDSRLPSRRHDLGDNTAAVGDDDRFARRRQADVFAELVLQDFQPDRAHDAQSSFWKLHCQHRISARHRYMLAGSARGGSSEAARVDAAAGRRDDHGARPPRAAEGDAGDRLSQPLVARTECTVCGRVPPGTKRNRLCRGTKRGDRIPLGGGPLSIGCPRWPPISSAARST